MHNTANNLKLRIVALLLLVICNVGFMLQIASSEDVTPKVEEKILKSPKPQKKEDEFEKNRRLRMDAIAKRFIRKYYSNAKTLSLCDAIIDENTNEMKKLISDGANINHVGKDGITPLIFAVRYKKRKPYELLLREKADPNLPLKKASTENGIKLVTFMNLMHEVSAIEDDPSWLKLALKYGGDPNSMAIDYPSDECGPRPPIFIAIRRCQNDVNFRILVKSGANIHFKDQCNCTPFLHAVSDRKYGIANMLLEKGADWTVVGDWGQDATFLCFIDLKAKKNEFPSQYRDHLTLLAQLKRKGADIVKAKEKAKEYFKERNYDPRPSRRVSLSELEKFMENEKKLKREKTKF